MGPKRQDEKWAGGTEYQASGTMEGEKRERRRDLGRGIIVMVTRALSLSRRVSRCRAHGLSREVPWCEGHTFTAFTPHKSTPRAQTERGHEREAVSGHTAGWPATPCLSRIEAGRAARPPAPGSGERRLWGPRVAGRRVHTWKWERLEGREKGGRHLGRQLLTLRLPLH